MAKQIINNGSSAGDPTAENIFTAFGKVKSNFDELYTFITTTIVSDYLSKAGGVLTGILEFISGSAAAPSVKVGSDQKGLYSVATDKLGITIAGTKIGEVNGSGVIIPQNRLVCIDSKTSGVNGDTAAIGDNDRELNTILVNTITGAGLSANKITLPIGRYFINYISCMSYETSANRIRLYNVTSATEQTDINSNDILGSSEIASATNYCSSIIQGYYFDVVTTPKEFKIIHYCAVNGILGVATSDGFREVYTILDIVKIA